MLLTVTFVAVGTLLPTVPLLLPGRVGTGVRDLLVETHVLGLDGSQVLRLRVLRPAVGGGGRGGGGGHMSLLLLLPCNEIDPPVLESSQHAATKTSDTGTYVMFQLYAL